MRLPMSRPKKEICGEKLEARIDDLIECSIWEQMEQMQQTWRSLAGNHNLCLWSDLSGVGEPGVMARVKFQKLGWVDVSYIVKLNKKNFLHTSLSLKQKNQDFNCLSKSLGMSKIVLKGRGIVSNSRWDKKLIDGMIGHSPIAVA